MTDNELDEAINDLSESEREALYHEAIHYCEDFSQFHDAEYREKHRMIESTMKMMMKERVE